MTFHIWILGLQNNYRGKKLEIQLNAQCLKFSNYWGYDGRIQNVFTKIENFDSSFSNFVHGRSLLATEVAASLGHIGIYEEVHNSNNDWGLILEDDAQIQDGLAGFLNNLRTSSKPTVISLNSGAGFKFKKKFKYYRDTRVCTPEVIQLLELPSLAHGYLVNQKAVSMMNFVDMRNLISVPDWPYVWPNSFQYYITRTNYVEVDSTNSTTLIGERFDLPASPPSYWMPSIKRLVVALKFGVGFKLAFYREVWIKILRVVYRIFHLITG